MLNICASLPSRATVKELLNLLWGYKCLNKASALIELKKNASATQEANMAVKILRNGVITREATPGLLISARSFQLAKNEVQAMVCLE